VALFARADIEVDVGIRRRIALVLQPERRAPERRSAIAAAAPICTCGGKPASRSGPPPATKPSAPDRYRGPARRSCAVPLPAILVKVNRRWPKKEK
jgi:hypothetical protein